MSGSMPPGQNVPPSYIHIHSHTVDRQHSQVEVRFEIRVRGPTANDLERTREFKHKAADPLIRRKIINHVHPTESASRHNEQQQVKTLIT